MQSDKQFPSLTFIVRLGPSFFIFLLQSYVRIDICVHLCREKIDVTPMTFMLDSFFLVLFLSFVLICKTDV